MTTTTLEHVNVTVQDPDKTAAMLCQLFDWQIRWAGSSIHGGRSVHVGTPQQYLAVYSMPKIRSPKQVSYEQIGGLNHLGVHVDDLDAVEQRVLAAGYKTFNHGDYEPGRRFYFRDDDNIEFEVLTYSREKT